MVKYLELELDFESHVETEVQNACCFIDRSRGSIAHGRLETYHCPIEMIYGV